MKEQKADRRRCRSLALAAVLIIFFALGPMIGWAAEEFYAGDRCATLTMQLVLWTVFLATGVLASALLAGWLRKRP